MKYFIGEAVKLTEKVFAHVLEIGFVMSFVLILIMAIRFAARKNSKSLSYGLWGAAGIGVLYAALPFLRRPFSGMMENIKAAGNIGSSIRGSGLFSKLMGLADMRLGAHAESVQAVGNAASEADLAAAATLSDVLDSISKAAKSVAAGGGAGLQKLAGAGANSMPNADGGAAFGGEAVQSAGSGISTLFSAGFSLWTLLSVLWAAGVIIFAAYSIFTAVRIHRRVRFAVRLQDVGQLCSASEKYQRRSFLRMFFQNSKSANDTVNDIENDTAKRDLSEDSEEDFCGISHSYRIYECEQIDSPFVAGILRPKIYLPAGLSEYDRSLILAHEVCHIKRKDHLVLLAAQTVVSMFWFHPLFWAAYIMMRRDMEMSCDERAIRGFDRSQVADYSAILLSFGLRDANLLTMAFGARPSVLKQRISNVLAERKRRPLLSVLSAAVCLCAAVIMVTAGCGLVNTETHFAEWFYPWIAGNMEEDEAEQLFQEIGTVVGESRTVDGVTVTFEGIVNDQNVLLLAFTVDGAEAKNESKAKAVYDVTGSESWFLPDQTIEELRNYEPEMTDEEIEEYAKSFMSFDTEKNGAGAGVRCSQYGENSYLVMFSIENYPPAVDSGVIHIEALDSYLFSLKGPYDFTFQALKTGKPVIYTGDVPFTTPSGVSCRVHKVVLNPLCGAEVQMTVDRDLKRDAAGPDGTNISSEWQEWESELLLKQIRTEKGYDVSGSSHRDNIGEEGREVTLELGSFYWILNTEAAEAVRIGENWIDLSEMTRSRGGE